MAQTYAEFKTFLTGMLWRQNDADLTANMDNLIRMADAELNRTLNIQRRQVTATIAPEVEDFALPADFYQMKAISNLEPTRQTRSGKMSATSVDAIKDLRARTGSTYIEPVYAVERASAANTLYLCGPFSASNAGSFSLTYRTTVPDYEGTDASWVEADYLDLYTYAVFKHCAIFLREDERIQQYAGLMVGALSTALDEDLREVEFGGSPLVMQPHHVVPQTRRKA